MPFQTDSLSYKGARQTNQDFCGHETASQCECWVIADGLGAHSGSGVASRLAGDAVLDSFRRTPELSSGNLLSWVEAANAAVVQAQQSRPELAGMRTTLVVLACDSRNALWVHLGDSRLYHFRGGRLHCFTKDHSVPQAMVTAGEITQAEVRFHEDRSR